MTLDKESQKEIRIYFLNMLTRRVSWATVTSELGAVLRMSVPPTNCVFLCTDIDLYLVKKGK